MSRKVESSVQITAVFLSIQEHHNKDGEILEIFVWWNNCFLKHIRTSVLLNILLGLHYVLIYFSLCSFGVQLFNISENATNGTCECGYVITLHVTKDAKYDVWNLTKHKMVICPIQSPI